MAASTKNHAEELEVEIIIGSYEHVLFGYELVNSEDSAVLNLSFTDKSHCASIRSLAVSSNKLLASGSADETIQLFDLKSRQEAGSLMKHNGTITNIEFHGEFMISSDDSGVICIWKILGRTYECMKTLTGHKGSVLSLSVHPSGKLLLSVGQDKTLRTWNLLTGKRAYTTNLPNLVDILCWSPDGEKYVLCYNGKLDVCLVTKAAPETSIKLPGKGHSLAFVANNMLAIGCEGGSVVFVDIDSSAIVHDFKVESNRIKCLNVKLISGDKSLLSFMSNDGLLELHLVRAKSNKVTTSLIAATKTILRPICMELVVKSEEKQLLDSCHTTGEEKSIPNVEKHRKSRKRPRDTHEGSTKEDVAIKKHAETGRKKVKGDTAVKSSNEKKNSRSQQQPTMDKLKKALSGKGKGEQSDDETQKVKKAMKPVDSVKITKQKFNEKKKQQRAKHHHITEHTDAA